MTAQEMIKDFLNDPERRDIIKIQAIEKKAGIPASSLTMFLTGKRSFPEKHLSKLLEVLKKIGYPKE